MDDNAPDCFFQLIPWRNKNAETQRSVSMLENFKLDHYFQYKSRFIRKFELFANSVMTSQIYDIDILN